MHKPVDIEYCLKVAVGLIASPIPPRIKHKPISLANYDVSFVNNAVRSINAGDGMSDRQRELSIKLVSKYTKQFRKLGIDVIDIVQNPVFTSDLRQVDRTKKIELVDDLITVKFPYSKRLISQFKSLSKKLRTVKKCEWSKESKVYEIDFNEYNLLEIYKWSTAHRFSYSQAVTSLLDQYKEILDNRGKYAIQLIVTDNNCYLSNAPDSLSSWWNDNMSNARSIKQIVKAADQNIDVVNKSKQIKISNYADRILNGRGGNFSYDECDIIDIVKAAKELEFERIAYIVDGRNIAEEQREKIAQAIKAIGKDRCGVQLKYLDTHFGAEKRLNEDTEFAILDSAQRYNHPRSQTTWEPDFVISSNAFTKFRNVFAEKDETKKPWVCYYTQYSETSIDTEGSV